MSSRPNKLNSFIPFSTFSYIYSAGREAGLLRLLSFGTLREIETEFLCGEFVTFPSFLPFGLAHIFAFFFLPSVFIRLLGGDVKDGKNKKTNRILYIYI